MHKMLVTKRHKADQQKQQAYRSGKGVFGDAVRMRERMGIIVPGVYQDTDDECSGPDIARKAMGSTDQDANKKRLCVLGLDVRYLPGRTELFLLAAAISG